MKFNTIVKIVTALAAAVGAIYIIATYGDKMVEWAKSIMGCCCKPAMNTPTAPAEDFVNEDAAQEAPAASEEAAEETATEETAAAEEAAVEENTEAVLADDAIPVADEEDFEG